MAPKIVVFGATGYTGERLVQALVKRGVFPVIAARSAEKLHAVAAGGLETRLADVARPETVRALVGRGDVLVSTVGPFARWGDPAVEAAIAAGATYIDSTGEPAFIRRVFEHYDAPARAAGAALLTASGYDWVPGNLAAALALQAAGPAATRVDVGYFTRGGGGISSGTKASMVGGLVEPSFALRHGRVVAQRSTALARSFELAPGVHRDAATVGGTEHFGLLKSHPTLKDVDVYLAMAGARRMPAVSALVGLGVRVPPLKAALLGYASRIASSASPGPDAAARSASSSTILAEAMDDQRRVLARTRLQGVNGYTFTFDFLAWAAHIALTQGVLGTGALGPVDAFGLERLEKGVREAGMAPVPD